MVLDSVISILNIYPSSVLASPRGMKIITEMMGSNTIKAPMISRNLPRGFFYVLVPTSVEDH